jgi:hypothetical protein
MVKTVQRPKSKAQSRMGMGGSMGVFRRRGLAEITERDTKGQKRTERDNIFSPFFLGGEPGVGCIALCNVTRLRCASARQARNYSKTH